METSCRHVALAITVEEEIIIKFALSYARGILEDFVDLMVDWRSDNSEE